MAEENQNATNISQKCHMFQSQSTSGPGNYDVVYKIVSTSFDKSKYQNKMVHAKFLTKSSHNKWLQVLQNSNYRQNTRKCVSYLYWRLSPKVKYRKIMLLYIDKYTTFFY